MGSSSSEEPTHTTVEQESREGAAAAPTRRGFLAGGARGLLSLVGLHLVRDMLIPEEATATGIRAGATAGGRMVGRPGRRRFKLQADAPGFSLVTEGAITQQGNKVRLEATTRALGQVGHSIMVCDGTYQWVHMHEQNIVLKTPVRSSKVAKPSGSSPVSQSTPSGTLMEGIAPAMVRGMPFGTAIEQVEFGNPVVTGNPVGRDGWRMSSKVLCKMAAGVLIAMDVTADVQPLDALAELPIGYFQFIPPVGAKVTQSE